MYIKFLNALGEDIIHKKFYILLASVYNKVN